jgi:hypothetical protein
MSRIRVYRPVLGPSEVAPVELAPRRPLPDGAHLSIVDNGKPKARELMLKVVDRLRGRLPIGAADVHSKPSAGAPIDADVARMLAVRSHLIICGLGD